MTIAERAVGSDEEVSDEEAGEFQHLLEKMKDQFPNREASGAYVSTLPLKDYLDWPPSPFGWPVTVSGLGDGISTDDVLSYLRSSGELPLPDSVRLLCDGRRACLYYLTSDDGMQYYIFFRFNLNQ